MKTPKIDELDEAEMLRALESGAIELEKPSRQLLADLQRASANTFKPIIRSWKWCCGAFWITGKAFERTFTIPRRSPTG
jgi:hypothetical protein